MLGCSWVAGLGLGSSRSSRHLRSKCRLYRLDSSTTAWVDLGSGMAVFVRDPASGQIVLKMKDKKTDATVMDHPGTSQQLDLKPQPAMGVTGQKR